MSIINQQGIKDDLKEGREVAIDSSHELKVEVDKQLGIKNDASGYTPSAEEATIRHMIIRHFTLANVTMFTPRVEFNDMAVVYRDQIDQMAFNTYQPNDGQAPLGDEENGWQSNAIRPIVRNKCISIGAHATARLMYPKIFAHDDESENQHEAAQVMMDLMEYTTEQSNYAFNSLYATIQAEVSPASIVHTEYREVYRDVKRQKDAEGKWVKERVCDETLSGFQDTIVPVDQLYIENFFEPDIQKQGWLIWRRVQSYSLLEGKYKDCPNWQYVKPGVQVIYNDANQLFYQVYDTNMRPYMAEEIIYWNRTMDLMICMVNGVMLTPHDNPNPRNDKLYPFAKFGYEFINSKCFYYKSLAFKVSRDANIINTLYPMIVDGTYLNLFPPMLQKGGEAIASVVVAPGRVTTLSDPEASLAPVRPPTDIKSGMDTLFKVDESLNQTSEMPVVPEQQGQVTAYQISKAEQERNTVLGMFIQMIGSYVKQYGTLRLGDIMQYLTIADVDQITDNPELVYKTFLLHNKKSNGKQKTRKIKFDKTLPSEGTFTQQDHMNMSYQTLAMEGGEKSDSELYRVNPELFRNLKYNVTISPDVLNPMSDDVERAMKLEVYDRAINNPTADQEKVFKDFLLGAYPETIKDPDQYLNKQQPAQGIQGQLQQATQQAQGKGQPQQQPGQTQVPQQSMLQSLTR